MTSTAINCPHCHREFPLQAALAHQLHAEIDAELRGGYETRFAKERESLRRELTRTAKAEADRLHAARLAELETAAVEHEAALKRAEAQLETTRREAGKRAHDEFQAERAALEAEMNRVCEASHKARVDYQTDIASLEESLSDARANELHLRREKVELEGTRQRLEVEAARTLDLERTRMRQELASAHSEAEKLREAEHARQVEGLREQVERLRRKLEVGGELERGEAGEICLEEVLRAAFPMDTIEPVARGVRGADVRQRICAPGQPPCGTILYESKHTANWSPAWLAKLRDDQQAERADIAVLVTAVLPRGVTTFALVDGVWVTTKACLPGLASALRTGLLQVASHRRAAVGRGEKMELVYAYLTGDQFRAHVEALVKTYADMGAQLLQEKRAITTAWHRREKQLERVTACITGLYGDLQAIAGASTLPCLELLELDDAA